MRYLALAMVSAGLSLALTGCVASNQQSNNLERYTLTQDVAPQVFMSQQDVTVELAPALNMDGVMIELSDITLRPAQNFRYVDALAKELRLLTIDEYMKQGVPNNYHTAIFISKFQGTLDGQVKLWAYIEVRNARNRLIFRDEFKREGKSAEDGYGPIVTSLKDIYIDIIDEVITNIKDGK